MSSDKAPEKVVYVKGNFSNEHYFVPDPTHHSGETVLATYVREDLTFKKQRASLIKFITWVRNHYAVNAVIDNKGMVDFYLEQEKS